MNVQSVLVIKEIQTRNQFEKVTWDH